MKANHKYRVSVYLGKSNYEELEAMADLFGISISQVVRIMLTTGMNYAQAMERRTANGRQ